MKVKPHRPETKQIAVAPLYSKFSSYPSHGLTPQKLAEIFKEADGGEVGRQMELYEEMEEHDPHLYAQLQTRKNAVTGLDWEITPFSDDPADEQIAEFVAAQLHGIRNLEDTFLNLLDAIGKGLSVAEILWRQDGSRTTVSEIKWVPPKLLRWDLLDELRIITEDAPTGILPPPNKMLVHRYKAKSGHPSRAGVLRVCAWMYLFKNYDVKDWAAFIEVFGLPLRLGKYAAGASQEDKDALWRALVHIGTDAAGMIAEGTTIDFITADGSKGSANGVYETMARYCDEQISKAILGQTLTADSGKTGSYAQSKTHNDVRHDLTVADRKALAATLRYDLIQPLVLFNFGDAATARLPSIVFDCELPEDLQSLAGILNTLSGIGVPIPLSHIYKKFSIPEPKAGEAVTHMPEPSGSLTNAPPNVPSGSPPSSPPDALRESLVRLANKAVAPDDFQRRTDRLADAAMERSFPIFERSLAPLCKLVDECADLNELREWLDDPDILDDLLTQCAPDELTNLLDSAMTAAGLAGRLREHDR